MATIDLPDDITFEAEFTPRPTVQVNRSTWNGSRRVLDLDNGYLGARASIVPVSREVEKRLVRAFHAALRDAANTFRLPATLCDQHSGAQPTVASGGAAGATTVTLSASIGLKAGQYLTVPQASGAKQLVILTGDMAGAVATFEPPLRLAAIVGATVDSKRPYGLVALVPGTAAPQTEGGVMGWAFEAEEAF